VRTRSQRKVRSPFFDACWPATRSLLAARGRSEPAGQIAAREIEIVRIKGALQIAEELGDDVARIRAIQRR